MSVLPFQIHLLVHRVAHPPTPGYDGKLLGWAELGALVEAGLHSAHGAAGAGGGQPLYYVFEFCNIRVLLRVFSGVVSLSCGLDKCSCECCADVSPFCAGICNPRAKQRHRRLSE